MTEPRPEPDSPVDDTVDGNEDDAAEREPRDAVAVLRDYATHFAHRDWDYTRDKGHLVALRYRDYADSWRYRGARIAEHLFRPADDLSKTLGVNRWRMVRHYLRRETHLPDGVLDGGNVLTHWEETGEYLQMVQPSVGELVADLLDTHRDLPEAQAVIAELERIRDRYSERIAAGEVTRRTRLPRFAAKPRRRPRRKSVR